MMDGDIESNCVRKGGSHTRNLLRVKRGLDMVRVLFEQIVATEYVFVWIILMCKCYFNGINGYKLIPLLSL